MKTIKTLLLICLLNQFTHAQSIVDSLVWARGVNAVGMSSLNIETDAQDNIIVAGVYDNCPQCYIVYDGDTLHTDGYGNDDLFLAKISSTGELIMSRLIGGPGDDRLSGLAVDNNDHVLLSAGSSFEFTFDSLAVGDGQNLLKFDETLTLSWELNLKGSIHNSLIGHEFMTMLSEQFAVNDLNEVILGGIISDAVLNVGGELHNTGSPFNFFIAKVSPNGDLQWVRIFEHSGFLALSALAFDRNREIIACGFFREADMVIGSDTLLVDMMASTINNNGFLIKIKGDGEVIWAKRFFDDIIPIDISIGIENDLIIASRYSPPYTYFHQDTFYTTDQSTDFLLFKVDPDGNYIWGKKKGGPGTNTNGYIVSNSDDEIYMSGEFSPLLGSIIQKYDAAGDFLWELYPSQSANRTGGDLTFDPSGNLIQTGMYNGDFVIGNEILEDPDVAWHPYILKFKNQSEPFNEPVATNHRVSGPDFLIFPNPVSETLHIAYDQPDSGPLRFELVNYTGQLIEHKMLSNVTSGISTFNVKDLPSGMYMVRLTSDRFSAGKPIVIVR